MKTVHHLPRLRGTQCCGFGKLFTTISTHNINLRMLQKPSFNGRAFPISKDINNFSSLQIDKNGSIGKTLLPGEVINTKHPNSSCSGKRQLHEMTQQRWWSRGDAYSVSQPCTHLPTCYQAKKGDECDESPGHACIGLNQPRKTLRKNFAWACWCATDEFAHGEHQQHVATCTGQIGNRPLVVSVDASRGLVALWTGHTCRMTHYANDEFSGTGMNGGDRDASGEAVSYTHLRAHETRHDLVC